ncbi:MBL fold metallo-hydrolase [Aureitalea sp. L0-47]|uniref:ComEC/Rec2 family competence protein n=1 Tax=Aureitalea sp. L0-47 TaxID=2816962 RepID=UPI002238E9DE|nr:MBL fold metallo-hydrolase [Aureitalea sp. L0-47]MCW5520819.1 MBL fold metallo-hydrolase [Aureitalea sp. L0-47]
MNLVAGKSYFVGDKSTVVRKEASKSSEALNQLIYGDWLMFKGGIDGGWAQIYSRGNLGWIPKSAIQEERVLEVNFVDIGIGDGCHIVTPDDEIILIDAGQTNNMSRFLNWRYNLRKRKVVGVDGVTASDSNTRPPFEIDYVVISHPDKDHYYGFKYLFENKKLAFNKVFHNGILERPRHAASENPNLHYYSSEDLGGWVVLGKKKYLWDTIRESQEMHDLIDLHSSSRKDYLSTLRALKENNPNVVFKGLKESDKYFEKFDDSHNMPIQILGPVTEPVDFEGSTKDCLYRLGSEGETKNGHSVIFRLHLGKLKVFLGGDLNTDSEDYLLKFYAETDKEASDLEHDIAEIEEKGHSITTDEAQELAEHRSDLENIIIKARKHFQVDIAKACHHGSHHFSETFLQCLNSIATVVSSGDGDSYAHPRPDALGSFGKYGRGTRPLIFSTEIGRSTNEFTHVIDYLEEIRKYEEDLKNATSSGDKKEIEDKLEGRKDSNVATYGMITLRTDGEKVFLAQKLEAPRKKSEKWDIHELAYNNELNEFQYVIKH